MPAIVFAALSGILFGLGLTVSAMVDPAKVLGFLDIAGNWDPSLAFVMGAAVPVAALGFALAARRPRPLAAPEFHKPGQSSIDRPLVLGAVLFGVGWGLAGLCPGPALAGLGLGVPGVWIFVSGMLAGMAAFEPIRTRAVRRFPGCVPGRS
jgi:uncharacterized membrane protein YedE/YeeE